MEGGLCDLSVRKILPNACQQHVFQMVHTYLIFYFSIHLFLWSENQKNLSVTC